MISSVFASTIYASFIQSPSSNYLNVNSLLPKINEICYVAERTKATVIGITESKLKSIFQLEIKIDNYDLLLCDRDRNGGGVVWYIRSDISYVQKDFFQISSKTYSLRLYCPNAHL